MVRPEPAPASKVDHLTLGRPAARGKACEPEPEDAAVRVRPLLPGHRVPSASTATQSSHGDTLSRRPDTILRCSYARVTRDLDGTGCAQLSSRNHSPGGVAERLKAAVLKTAGPQGLAGSNPASSANAAAMCAESRFTIQ